MDNGLALELHNFIAQCPDLPVTQDLFFLDTLPKDKCLSLRMQGGEVLHNDIDGYKQIRYPFNLLFKDTAAQSPEERSAMIESLNKTGTWMASQSLPAFDNMTWEKISQTIFGAISTDENEEGAYIAKYVLILSFIEN